MKNKGMIAAICLILVLGIVTTAATRRYIREQAESEIGLASESEAGAVYEAAPFAAAEASGMGAAGEAPAADGEVSGSENTEKAEADAETDTEMGDAAMAEADEEDSSMNAGEENQGTASRKKSETEKPDTEEDIRVQSGGDAAVQSSGSTRRDKRTAAKAAEKQAPGNTENNSVNAGAVASPVENGIISPAGGASSGAGVNSDRTAQDYRDRLSEIENTIQNLENAGGANTTDAMREAATYEYRLWDAELNQIYQAIMAVLPEEEADTLRSRERKWIRKRDTTAKQDSERYKGGTMESVEYTASLAASTRDRAYELLDLYESYLPVE